MISGGAQTEVPARDRRDVAPVGATRAGGRGAHARAAGVPVGFGVDENTALLVEDGCGRVCGEYGVIVVDVPIDTQVDRLKARSDLDDQQARARVNAQASRDERLEVADWVIENCGSYDQLRQQDEVVWDALNKKVRSL